MKGHWFFKGIKVIIGIALYITVLAWVIMLLWNGFIPKITGWMPLNYTNALMLLVLVRLLVGFRVNGAYYLKHKLGRKWSNLSDEERDQLREKFKSRWCSKGE